MAQVDFYSLIQDQPDKTDDFRTNVLVLFDKMIHEAQITNEEKVGILVRLRAKIQIELNDF